MNFNKLKEQFIEKKFQKNLNEVLNNREISNKVINSVAILTSEEIASKIDLQKAVEENLKVRNCKIFKFRPFYKSDATSYSHFSEKDINWRGKIKNISFQIFLDQPFDLLITYLDTKNLYVEYSTLVSKATFKVGFANVNQSLFDIEIAEKSINSSIFLSELNTYLKILKKIEN